MVAAYDYQDEEEIENIDFLDLAKEELKRVDHQVYVTLKYTRTVDVLINVVLRMIDAYSALIDAILCLNKTAEEDLLKLPIIEKTKRIMEFYVDDEVKENMQLYLLLRKISKSKNYKKESEYRRPVCMKTIIDGHEIELNIDLVTHYYAILMSFYKFIEILYKNKASE